MSPCGFSQSPVFWFKGRLLRQILPKKGDCTGQGMFKRTRNEWHGKKRPTVLKKLEEPNRGKSIVFANATFCQGVEGFCLKNFSSNPYLSRKALERHFAQLSPYGRTSSKISNGSFLIQKDSSSCTFSKMKSLLPRSRSGPAWLI